MEPAAIVVPACATMSIANPPLPEITLPAP
jgi:hypothetical protein